MKRIIYIMCMALSALTLCTACDDGRIPEKVRDISEKGRVATLDADITGTSSWAKGYTVALAGFTDDGTYAEISKDIKPDANGHVNLTLPGIPEEVTKLEVCVINSIRKRVVTLYTTAAADNGDTIRIKPDAAINAGMLAAIQASLFDKQCAHCHSGSAWAASLNLNDGKSYAQLVNVASAKEPGKMRVLPGQADASVLYEALATKMSSPDEGNWKHDHSNIMATDRTGLQLLKDWIDSGAKE